MTILITNLFYNDNVSSFTYAYLNDFVDAMQTGTYFDENGNNIVDLGDSVLYEYSFFNSVGNISLISIQDNNATVTLNGNTATGIHYITQEEIDFGYVYNSANATLIDGCGNFFEELTIYGNFSCFNCPNPNNDALITVITTLPPHKITGTVSFDLQDDGCSTGIVVPRRAVKAVTSSLNYRTFTNNLGFFEINIPNISESYTVSALENLNASFNSTPASHFVTSSNSAFSINYNNTNFCLNASPDFNDVSIVYSNINDAIPGTVAQYLIHYQNNGTTSMNGTINLSFDGVKLTYNTAGVAPTVITTSTLSWDYTNLQPFETRTILVSFNVLIPPIVTINDVLSFTAQINPLAGDNLVADNTYVLNQTVRSSYDPNDKTVLEGAFITLEQANNYLTYLTRFQNSGTANAMLVVIKEILDANLDWDTFTPIAESHNGFIEILNGNELTYTFPNIDLPYESIEPELSIGWMLYKIKPKPGFAIGDIASSKSDIYFDFNPPIITNTVTTQIAPLSVTAIAKTNFTISPNPTSNSFTIAMKEIIDASYEIVSINGKTVSNGIVKHMQPIAIDNLEQGFYFVTISTLNDKMTYKLVKK